MVIWVHIIFQIINSYKFHYSCTWKYWFQGSTVEAVCGYLIICEMYRFCIFSIISACLSSFLLYVMFIMGFFQQHITCNWSILLVLNSLWWTIVGHPVQSLVGCCLCVVMFGIGVDHPLFSSILFAAEEWGLTLGSTECFKGILIFNLEVKLCCWCCWGYGAFLTWFLLYKNSLVVSIQ